MFDQPLIKRSVTLKLKSTERMCNVLDGIRLAVGKIVSWVNAPLVTGLMVGNLAYPIDDRVAQVHIR